MTSLNERERETLLATKKNIEAISGSLNQDRPAMSNEIHNYISYGKSKVSGYVSQLRQKGLVRVIRDEFRADEIYLTDEGMKALQNLEENQSQAKKFLEGEISVDIYLELDDYAIPDEPRSHGKSNPQKPEPDDLDIPESEIPYSEDAIPNRDVWPKWVTKQNLIDEWKQWFDELEKVGETDIIVGSDWDYASAKFQDWLDRKGIDY